MTPKTKAKPKSPQPPAESDGDLLADLTWELGRAYYAYVGLAERILIGAKLDAIIRPGMGHVLFALYEADDRTVKEIAARSQLASSTLAGLLLRMEKVKLIERRRDTVDQRCIRVRLTPLGRKLEPKCHEMLKHVRTVSHAAVGEKNVSRAKQLLQQLIVAFRKEEENLADLQLPPELLKAKILRQLASL